MKELKNNVEQASRLSNSNVVQASSLLKKHRQDACSTLIKTVAIFAISAICTVRSFAEDASAKYASFEGNYKMAELSPGIIHEYKDGKLVHKFTPAGGGSIRTFKKLANGNYLMARRTCVVEVDTKNEIVFQYKEKEKSHNYCWVKRLENGNTLIIATGHQEMTKIEVKGKMKNTAIIKSPPFMKEITLDGKIVKTVNFEFTDGINEKGNTVYQLRGVCELKNGNFVFAHQTAKKVNEYTNEGKFVRTVLETVGGAVSVSECSNGNILIGTACGATGFGVYEVDATGKVVWDLKYDDLPEAQPHYVTDAQKLENGNYLIISNSAHSKKDWNGFPVFEVTTDKKIVRAITDNQGKKFNIVRMHFDK